MSGLINALVGLVLGLLTGGLTGYIFERRSSKEARERSSELEAQIRLLKDSLFAAGVDVDAVVSRPAADGGKFSDEIMSWIRCHQDPTGRVRRSYLAMHFIRVGYPHRQLQDEIEKLSSTGKLIVANGWVEIS